MRNKIIIVIVFISLLVGLCFLWKKREQALENAAVREVINQYKDADIKAVIIPSTNHTFGYDIYVHSAVLIHQPSRPGLPGNTGFATLEDAMKVANFVIKKIHNNELPPTVTIEELRELEVLKN